MSSVVRLGPDAWDRFRALRLEALQESPHIFASTYAHEATFADDKWRERCGAGDEPGVAAVFAVEVDGQLRGMAGAMRDYEVADDVRLWGMWVAPELRGSGVASDLVDAVCSHATKVGATAVHLSVLASNERAWTLYQRHGFEIVRTEPFPDPERPGTDYVMRRTLGA